MNPATQISDLQLLFANLRAYAQAHPTERHIAQAFIDFLASGDDVFLRTRMDGHFTASCWLLSADGERVLLTHHRKLARWLQLGGHADGQMDLAKVALTEAIEESGLSDLAVEPSIFDLDAHLIPARGGEAAHTHWDVRFVLRCAGSENYQVSAESLALAWLPIAQMHDYPDASLQRMARKWQARTLIG